MNNNIRSYDESTKRAALVVSTLAGFLTPFMGSSMNVALPAIATEFSMKAVSMSWVPMAYMLAAAVSLVPFGRLGDIRGRKKVFVIGLAVSTRLVRSVGPGLLSGIADRLPGPAWP